VTRVLQAGLLGLENFAGKTFYKLERCRVTWGFRILDIDPLPFTEMPVCTRLDIEDTEVLATFKLPLLCELGVTFDYLESNLTWEEEITVNVNLSGLRLLHIHGWHLFVNLIQILRSVPVLDTLIVGNGAKLDVDFFRALVPNKTSRWRESCGVTQFPTVLCPILNRLQVEGIDPTKKSGLMHVLRGVVRLRAVAGSPLQGLTLWHLTLSLQAGLN
jgi:hypothetical protein